MGKYISNPTLIDTDYDGIPDGEKDYDEISTVSMFNSGGYRSIKTRLDEEPISGEFEATARIKKCKEDLETEKLLRFSKVEIEKDSGTLVSFYRAKVNYCPAYVMQTLANMASEVGPRTGRNLSGKYNSAKWSFIGSSGEIKIKEKPIIGGKAIVGGMTHPHMPITYYLIVNNDFKNI